MDAKATWVRLLGNSSWLGTVLYVPVLYGLGWLIVRQIGRAHV